MTLLVIRALLLSNLVQVCAALETHSCGKRIKVKYTEIYILDSSWFWFYKSIVKYNRCWLPKWKANNMEILRKNLLKIKLFQFLKNLHLFYKQLGSRLSPPSCLYFQDFWGSELLSGSLVVWPNKSRRNTIIFRIQNRCLWSVILNFSR